MAALTPPVFVQSGGQTAQTARLAVGAAVLTSGVLNPADLLVSAPGGAMTVSVAAGQGWVVGSRTNQGTYHGVNDAALTLTVAASDPTNPRYDRVVAQIKDAAYSGSVNDFDISIIQGTPASSPTEPAIPADSFELCRITVGAAVTAISSTNLLDRRVRAVLRGVVFSPAAAADPGVVVKGAASQTGDFQQWQNSGGTTLAAVDPAGGVFGTYGFFGQRANVGGALNVQPLTTAGVGQATRALSGQTGDLAQWQNSGGTIVSKFTADGSPVFCTNGTTGMAIGSVGPQLGSGLTISNAVSDAPSVAGAGTLYVLAGALKFRGASGTITTIAAA